MSMEGFFDGEGYLVDRAGLIARIVGTLEQIADYRLEGIADLVEAAAARCPR